MRDIVLNIQGFRFWEGDGEVGDITVFAKLQEGADACVISYPNEDLTDSTITVKKNRVICETSDAENEPLIFEKFKPYTISYNTPLGPAGVDLYTTMVQADIEKSRGKIEIEYLMNVLGTQMANKLFMSYDER